MNKYSIAIFGSAARHDEDNHSDKDLLICSNDYKLLNQYKDKYQNNGWSVSTYTYRKLNYLSKNGSLFVKHLKKEATIIQDTNNSLENILLGFKPKKGYQNDINESLSYFEILESIPKTPAGFFWFCDCFYVGLRNYLILLSASESQFIFSYNQLIQNLLKSDKITINEYKYLE